MITSKKKIPIGLKLAIKSPQSSLKGEKMLVFIGGEKHVFSGFASTSVNTATTGTPATDGCIADTD